MNKSRQATYLLGVVLSFLVAIGMIFFAATESKNTLGLSAVAVFWVLSGAVCVYLFAKGRRTL
jgi:hypothetical protein